MKLLELTEFIKKAFLDFFSIFEIYIKNGGVKIKLL